MSLRQFGSGQDSQVFELLQIWGGEELMLATQNLNEVLSASSSASVGL